jgi:hypothetical protein
LSEGDDGVFGDGIGELSAIEISPVEDVVVDVEGVIGAASVVVASAAALVTQDGVGESDFLELCVGGIFVFGLDLVFVELVDEKEVSREGKHTRVPLQRGLSVSSLDLVLGGSLFDSEHLVGLDGWRVVELKIVNVCRHD